MIHRLVLGVTFFVALALPAAAQVGAPSTPQSSTLQSSTPQSAARPAYTYVGQSRANVQLKNDVMIMVSGYSRYQHSCKTITTVETAPLRQGYEPKTAMFRVSEPQHFYERWTADVCGTKRAFLVAMWPSPKGGVDFKVVEVPPGTEP